MSIRLLAVILLAAPATLALAENPVHHHSVHRNVRHKVTHASYSRSSSRSGGMDTERATQIQSALIKQGYLTGEPSGAWDTHTVTAMQKLQSDNGWQTKMTPDSRALIKLGLGPQANTAPASAQ